MSINSNGQAISANIAGHVGGGVGGGGEGEVYHSYISDVSVNSYVIGQPRG